MKKILLPLFCLIILFTWSCQSDDLHEVTPVDEHGTLMDEAFAARAKENGNGNAWGKLRSCASHTVLHRNLKKDPTFARNLAQNEAYTTKFINEKLEKAKKDKKPKKPRGGSSDDGSGGTGSTGGSSGGTVDTGGSTDGNDGVLITDPLTTTYTIPVFVHVVYNTPEQNISIEQIRSQIAALNADFSATNPDLAGVPAEFADRIANAGITFTWNEQLHIKRVHNGTRTSWGTNDEVKFSKNGGSDAYFPETYLNIWICMIGKGIDNQEVLGYAQFPGGSSLTDGIVVNPHCFGTTGALYPSFNKGRTATHEIGHWLNLRHIWGDGGCNIDDFVADTPTSDRPNFGCPTTPPLHCNSNDMTMNYMDYTDDACMYMFTTGQKLRMHALFATGGARSSFAK